MCSNPNAKDELVVRIGNAAPQWLRITVVLDAKVGGVASRQDMHVSTNFGTMILWIFC